MSECEEKVCGTGNLPRTYIWGSRIDNLLSVTLYPALTNYTALTISTPVTYYAVKDHQNSVIALVNKAKRLNAELTKQLLQPRR